MFKDENKETSTVSVMLIGCPWKSVLKSVAESVSIKSSALPQMTVRASKTESVLTRTYISWH